MENFPAGSTRVHNLQQVYHSFFHQLLYVIEIVDFFSDPCNDFILTVCIRFVFRFRARACFDATTNHIFVIGGRTWLETLRSVEILKVDELGRPLGVWQKFKETAQKRNGCCAVILDDK